MQKASKDQADTVAEPAASVTETTGRIGITSVAQTGIGFEFSTREIESHVAGAETTVSTPPALKNAA